MKAWERACHPWDPTVTWTMAITDPRSQCPCLRHAKSVHNPVLSSCLLPISCRRACLSLYPSSLPVDECVCVLLDRLLILFLSFSLSPSLHDPTMDSLSLPPQQYYMQHKEEPGCGRMRRCQALYDCDADREDELSFEEGEVIVVLKDKTDDEDWMEGFIESDAGRRGLFPASFVRFLTES